MTHGWKGNLPTCTAERVFIAREKPVRATRGRKGRLPARRRATEERLISVSVNKLKNTLLLVVVLTVHQLSNPRKCHFGQRV